jgi:nitronate monooxygenase
MPAAWAAWARCNPSRRRSPAGRQLPRQQQRCLPDQTLGARPAPIRDSAREEAARAALARLGPEPALPGDGPFLPDFTAQQKALLATRPTVVSTIMGLWDPEFITELKARGILWICNATTLAEARAAEPPGPMRWWRKGPRPAAIAAASRRKRRRPADRPVRADAAASRTPSRASDRSRRHHGRTRRGGGPQPGRQRVQLGTAFLRCPEAGLPAAYADALATAAPEDTVLTRAFSGRLARGIANDATRLFEEVAPAPYPLQRVLSAPMRAAALAEGAAGRMQLWAGQGAAMARAEPAADVVRRIWADAEALLA